jgi:hypothetical protein
MITSGHYQTNPDVLIYRHLVCVKNQQVTLAEFASIHTILFVVLNWHFLVIITLTNKGTSLFLDIPSISF